MLQINQLTLTHLKDLNCLVSDLSLVVNDGDKLAIIGDEGTGKSTLLKTLISPTLVDNYCQVEGGIQNHFQTLGYLPQALSKEEETLTIAEFLYNNIDYLFDFNRFYQMANRLQLDIQKLEDNQLKLSDLSGGEVLKLQLAKLSGEEPELLLLDEPSSNLDKESIKILQGFIQTYPKTIIFISHDETLLENTATAILHLELIKHRQVPHASHFSGNYKDYLSQRKQAYTKQLDQAKNDRKMKKLRDKKIQRLHQAAQHNVRHTHDSTLGRLAAKKMKNVLSLERRYAREDQTITDFPDTMDSLQLFFKDIPTLDKKKVVLSWKDKLLSTGQIVNLNIFGQDKMVITGRNGIGKTRLLKEIYQELTQNPQFSIGYMPQNYDSLFHQDMTALSFLTEVTQEESARTLLASLQFTREEIEHSVFDLSGGQKAKLFLARMVVAKNNILLLDEPTRYFSPTSQPLIRQLLKDFQGCIISVSHDRKFIEEVAGKCVELTRNHLELL